VSAPASEEGLERPQATIEFWAEYLAAVYPLFLLSDDFDAEHGLARLESRFGTKCHNVSCVSFPADEHAVVSEAYMEATKANTLAVREESETLKRELERLDTQRVGVSSRRSLMP
jgi:hypothetical protein